MCCMYYTSICWQTRCHRFFILISRVWKTVTNASTLKQIMKKCLQKTPTQNHSCFSESNDFFLASGSEEETAENLWVGSVSAEVNRK